MSGVKRVRYDVSEPLWWLLIYLALIGSCTIGGVSEQVVKVMTHVPCECKEVTP